MSEDTLQIEVNGESLTARKGQMLIEVTDGAGITVPRFCYHEKLPVAANCRMCLVDVEKMPKPVPACATPVMDGMVVRTTSERALNAQRAVMEFLLINHPLDCPVCDEGGECQLQDTALGFGQGESNYIEQKRTVAGKNLGALIATEMTRCIHCTRCVRFGEEIGGIQEMGGTGRGENLRIGTYVERAIESEVSGNMIDLCPVGALTSKPFRFTARSWELQRHSGVAPHDCVGSNLQVHTSRGEVKRVVPLENEAVNELWLSDRDRFSYTALDSDERLLEPQIKENGNWRQASWQEAIEAASKGIRQAISTHGAEKFGALASPGQSNEEYFLLQQLVRGVGSNNVDHRLRQGDFSADTGAGAGVFPRAVEQIESSDLVVLVGSNLRKDQPLLWVRVRNAQRKQGIKLIVVNPQNYDLTIAADAEFIGAPDQMGRDLAALATALGDDTSIQGWQDSMLSEQHQRAVQLLRDASNPVVIVGNQAYSSANYAALRELSSLVAQKASASYLEVCYGANSQGAWQAGVVPHRGPGLSALDDVGLDAKAMLESPLSAYLLLGLEAEHDVWDTAAALQSLGQADSVTVLSAFVTDTMRNYADVLLPIAPFTETSGSMVNVFGMRQSYRAAVKPLGEARPAWKVLRVLANELEVEDSEYIDLAQLTAAFLEAQEATPVQPAAVTIDLAAAQQGLQRVADAPIYAVDSLVRRAAPLQQRADALPAAVYLSSQTAASLQLQDGDQVLVEQGAGSAQLPAVVDDRVASNTIYIPAGTVGSETLGPLNGAATVKRV